MICVKQPIITKIQTNKDLGSCEYAISHFSCTFLLFNFATNCFTGGKRFKNAKNNCNKYAYCIFGDTHYWCMGKGRDN